MAENLIKIPFVFLATHEKFPELLGYISHEGDLGKEQPKLFYIDTQSKTVTLQYRSGREEKIADLDDDNAEYIHNLEQRVHDSAHEPQMGLFRCNDAGDMISPCYQVDVILI